MKKKLFFSIFCIAVACVGALGFGFDSPKKDLMLANVEALSESENVSKTCYSSITSKDGCQVRYCPICKFVDGKDSFYSSAETCYEH